MVTQKAKNKYDSAMESYVNLFCQKQGLEFQGWGYDGPCGSATCGENTYALHDIIWDVNSNQPKGLIVDFYSRSMEGKATGSYYDYTQNGTK